MWTNSLRNAIFAAVLVEYLSTRRLLSLPDAALCIGSESLFRCAFLMSRTDFCSVKPEWSSSIALPVEDYLHSLITVVNELVSFSLSSIG